MAIMGRVGANATSERTIVTVARVGRTLAESIVSTRWMTMHDGNSMR
jgi:hypothetical protein